jgi:hypothetical protein
MKIHLFYMQLDKFSSWFLQSLRVTRSYRKPYVACVYAWTTDKDLAKAFKRWRNMKYFKYVKTEYSDQLYSDLNSSYPSVELQLMELSDMNNAIMLPITDEEYIGCTDRYYGFIRDPQIFNIINNDEIEVFKSKYQDVIYKFIPNCLDEYSATHELIETKLPPNTIGIYIDTYWFMYNKIKR